MSISCYLFPVPLHLVANTNMASGKCFNKMHGLRYKKFGSVSIYNTHYLIQEVVVNLYTHFIVSSTRMCGQS